MMLSAVLCLCLAVPPSILGVAGAAADWNQTAYPGEIPLPPDQLPFILPLALQYLCPLPVSIVGLAAISAAAMSSADSTTLSTASIFANNWYKGVFRTKASDREIIWVLRITVIVVAVLGSVLAITSTTVYGLYVMAGDPMYVILFPQLTCVVFIRVSNTYGSLFGFFIAIILRLLSGDPLLGLPAVIFYPFYDYETGSQLFPFRTCIMTASFLSIILVSLFTEALFRRKWIPLSYDVFGYFTEREEKRRMILSKRNSAVKQEELFQELKVNPIDDAN